ncbi:uncharacterized protein PGTG_05184 [Puccinia graminis f. sp. tritici CRL 75-36-700-3]|uniref:Uncharacterized protein n=1 Tax=Puccinia graminis f. sp. tritici (strain CRL 75-36-700-3 / race SCCL) TaxID=418459 RepID=E3K700_PUCGT|nr:uncharacterized protein PGTG_05184 [Puccinia graminis f. sp. tritici CRL 75-36-700-3]EFP79959.1 hypothetical protein PGTG_05184 [Puccinia graminis f. sp. tritici CRL 75-36-700-3]
MPKASRSRLIHASQSKTTMPLSKRQFSLPEDHSQRLEQVDPTTSANEILHELNEDPKAYVLSSSSSKTTTKHNSDRRVIRARDSAQPYSKSHAKRLKKKGKEQVVVGELRRTWEPWMKCWLLLLLRLLLPTSPLVSQLDSTNTNKSHHQLCKGTPLQKNRCLTNRRLKSYTKSLFDCPRS